MPAVRYVDHRGQVTLLDVPVGRSVMQAAVENGVEPIVGECGGSCMCATCHVYVPEEQLGLLPPMTPAEHAMLEATASERRPNSRLSCQLPITAEMDGLVVHLPETEI